MTDTIDPLGPDPSGARAAWSGREAFSSRSDFRSKVVDVVAGACLDGRKHFTMVDNDFSDWPLDDSRLLDALTRFAKLPERRLLVIARSFESVPRRHPRFTQWRRMYAHRIVCKCVAEMSEHDVPTLLLAGELYNLQLLDKRRWQGRWLDDDGQVKAWHEVVEAMLQKAVDDFPANTLGL